MAKKIQLCNKGCGRQIYVAETDVGWRPFNADTETMHDCPNFKKVSLTTAQPTTTTTTTEPVLKQNVGSSNSILLQLVQKIEVYMETQSTILEKILERVMEKATSNNVSTVSRGVDIDKLSNRVEELYELVEVIAAHIQEIKKHLKISTFQTGKDLQEQRQDGYQEIQEERREARQEDVDEIADTDDLTKLGNPSINYVGQDE